MDELRALNRPDGAVLAYRVWRPSLPGRTLVLLHGLASNLTRWSALSRETRLRESWTLIRPDLRGQGRSVWRGRITVAQWCDDLLALLEAEGVGRAVVGGHCLGANLALAFAARHPERTAGLVLVEPMPRQALTGTLRLVRRLRPLLVALGGCARALSFLGCHRRRLSELDLEALDRETRAALARGAVPGEVLRRYASPWLDLRSTPTAAYLQALVAVTERLPEPAAIRAPALALLAAGSAFTDAPRVRAALAALPDCEIVELEARHWIPTEQPEAMRLAIERWLSRRFAADAEKVSGTFSGECG